MDALQRLLDAGYEIICAKGETVYFVSLWTAERHIHTACGVTVAEAAERAAGFTPVC